MNNWKQLQRELIIEGKEKNRLKIKNLKSGLYSAKDIKLLFEPSLFFENEYWGLIMETVEPISENGGVEMNMKLTKFREHELGNKYIDITNSRNPNGLLPILKIN